ncbi:MAG: hypothetical protein OET90_08260 [Desulfuromonadales bacterium]|nr:hypothetical protein [Desulfuromonadales bacterium]
MRVLLVLLLALLLCLIPVSLWAVDLGKVQVNGFLSQGYMKSQHNAFLDPGSKDGTFDINEFGITVNAPVSEKLRVGMQLLSRDLGEEGNNDIELDWAFGDYRFNDWFGVRAGKVKMPIGLYNESRDSDFLRAMAFLPQSIYDEARRSFLVAGVGGGLYGNVALAEAGDFDYKLFYGQIDIPTDTYLVQESIEKPLSKHFNNNYDITLTDLNYHPDYTFAGALVYNPPLEGLRLGFSWFRTMGEWEAKSYGNQLLTIDANIKSLFVVSAEYICPDFSLHVEYMQRDNDVKIPEGTPYETTVSEGGYLMATYPVPQMEGLSVSAMYDVFYLDKDNHNGSSSNPKEIGWRKDLAVGVRYDFNENWLVKAEWHTVDGAAPNMDFYNEGPLDEDWSYYIFKTSFNF